MGHEWAMGWVDQAVVIYLTFPRVEYVQVIRHIPIGKQPALPVQPTDLFLFPYGYFTGSSSFKRYCSSFLPFHTLNHYFRLPCLGTSTCSYTVQYASNEPNHDRRWNCVMEEKGRRNFFHGRRSPRDCKLPGHVFHLC